ncbi:TetR family transcriptional regulator [Aeromicrobium sp. CF3.5]|uniref:TetR family transcriptional regulator n=1 Tax=Aeromicrobium sp. CF3.5 TaxID=3373078 RepID=UPI003EE5A87D
MAAIERPSERPAERLVEAAFELFDEQGFDATTVDDIAARAGVGRTTFFRHYRSKEAVIFPAHDDLLARIGDRLAASDPSSRDRAVIEAARIVLRHYVAEGDRAVRRYRLITAVATLRDREMAGLRQYQRLFAQALAGRWPDQPDGDLRAELMASAVVSAHNYVLRAWLRGESSDPEAELDRALSLVIDQASRGVEETTSVVVVQTSRSPEVVVDRIRDALR